MASLIDRLFPSPCRGAHKDRLEIKRQGSSNVTADITLTQDFMPQAYALDPRLAEVRQDKETAMHVNLPGNCSASIACCICMGCCCSRGVAPFAVSGAVARCSMGINAWHACAVPSQFVTQLDEGSQ